MTSTMMIGAFPADTPTGPTAAPKAPLISPEVWRDNRFALPCQTGNADLWFAEAPADLEAAKAACGGCPLRTECLRAALERAEPWGVWGGEIFDRGTVVARKRPRGRPRKHAVT